MKSKFVVLNDCYIDDSGKTLSEPWLRCYNSGIQGLRLDEFLKIDQWHYCYFKYDN